MLAIDHNSAGAEPQVKQSHQSPLNRLVHLILPPRGSMDSTSSGEESGNESLSCRARKASRNQQPNEKLYSPKIHATADIGMCLLIQRVRDCAHLAHLETQASHRTTGVDNRVSKVVKTGCPALQTRLAVPIRAPPGGKGFLLHLYHLPSLSETPLCRQMNTSTAIALGPT